MWFISVSIPGPQWEHRPDFFFPVLLLSSLYVHKNVQERCFFRFLLLLLGWRDTLGFLHCKSEKTYHFRHYFHVNYIIMRIFYSI